MGGLPIRFRDEFMSWITTKPIAHRGLHNNKIPENSLGAFKNAIEKGYATELDVHLSIDGEIIVFHDDNFLRMTGFDGLVEATSSSKIDNLVLNGTKEKVPRFSEVLELVDAKVPILIEIKNKYQVGPLEKSLAALLKNYEGEYAIQSFNPYSLKWFRHNFPIAPRGQLSCDFKNETIDWYEKFILRNLLMNWISRPDFIAYDINLLPHWAVTRLKNKRMPILAWTIDSIDKQYKAKQYADNIIFEGILP